MRSIADLPVYPIGIGCAGMSVADPAPAEESVRTLHAAFDAGVRLVDSASCYIPSGTEQGHNEALIARAISSWDGPREEVVVATKCVVKRVAGVSGHVDFANDFQSSGRPEFLRDQWETSARALGVETIDVYQTHGVPDDVPWVEVIGTLKELQDEGRVRHIGLCNVSVDQLEEARTVADIVSVQNRFNPGDRSNLPALRRCEELGIAFLPYSPLGGLGQRARELGNKNPAFAKVAESHGVSPQQVALAWELSLAPVVIPIPGARRPETIVDSAAAAALELTTEDLDLLNQETLSPDTSD